MLNKFETSDTALAAFLASQGINLQRLETSTNPALFTFAPRDDEENYRINDYISLWETDTAMGNCNTFFRIYRNYIRRIKDAQSSAR